MTEMTWFASLIFKKRNHRHHLTFHRVVSAPVGASESVPVQTAHPTPTAVWLIEGCPGQESLSGVQGLVRLYELPSICLLQGRWILVVCSVTPCFRLL